MKYASLLTLSLAMSAVLFAQRTVKLHNLWAKPQVHVLFEGYTLSFKIKDINRTIELLNEIGDTTYGITSGLDTLRQFPIELYPGLKLQYRNTLQPLVQRGVGCFLLLSGQAYIVNKKKKKLKEIVANIVPVKGDDELAYVNFYDPKNNKLIFSGCMPIGLYNRDLGIDY
jgi:hypothetical protein